MCGRYSLFTPPDDLEDRFGASFDWTVSPRYNAAPSQRLPVITDETPETFERFEWGLVPEWADDSDGIINARAETIDEKPSFRDAYRGRSPSAADSGGSLETPAAGRCLVPADGFYEWVETPDGNRPYRVAFENDRPFAMAGLWTRREPTSDATQTGLDAFGGGADLEDETGGPLETFTVVTTEPNDLVADLHGRMAVILKPDDERRWLTGDDPRDVLAPYPDDELRAYPVSTAVNDPSVDDRSLIDPIET
ncbi:SOS response-associated peptidase [Natrialba swarupiae]|uniref:SOS response-associated peptidase n=1 Tax=Natrialba swarupiae TaxID=2448032 RepID=A0A5D5ANZ8_9EURY|nr:SOS response-associated peptidase [Natrialba swarupiae]TYT61180.1 SOS response-associated peptidase [Natrialba swarupiae]